MMRESRFPHVNEAAAVDEMIQALMKKLAFMWLGAFVAVGGIVGISFMLWRSYK